MPEDTPLESLVSIQFATTLNIGDIMNEAAGIRSKISEDRLKRQLHFDNMKRQSSAETN